MVGFVGHSVAPDQSATKPRETYHQLLQKSLSQRVSGGPREQVRSRAFRLRNTSSCDILHSSLQEPLSAYKSLEQRQPAWPRWYHRYHLTDGFRVTDQETVVVPARDVVLKTKKGLLRSASGTITYSSTHRTKAELDVEFLAQVLLGGPPGGGHHWTLPKLETQFFERTGRPGVWQHYEIGFPAFLELFPKTFEMFGGEKQFVRLCRYGSSTVLDDVEDAMLRLAKSRKTGTVEHFNSVTGQPMLLRKASADLDVLLQILAAEASGGRVCLVSQLEMLFNQQVGRPGVWAHFEMGLRAFLEMFPKTIEIRQRPHGQEGVCLHNAEKLGGAEGDREELRSLLHSQCAKGMLRLLKGYEDGTLQRAQSLPALPAINGKVSPALLDLQNNRFKAVFLAAVPDHADRPPTFPEVNFETF